MTTIAYKRIGKGAMLACDSQSSDDGLLYKAKSKAQVVGDKVYIICGTLGIGLAMIKWIESGSSDDCPIAGLSDDDSTEIFEMDLITGKAQLWEASPVPLPIEDKMAAKGTGAGLAIGAMAMGATPTEAITVASKWDEATGMGVQTFKTRR